MIPRKAVFALVALLGLLLADVAQGHVLTASRAANANKFVTRAVCESIVDDRVLGTCSDWTSGPCRRVSAHRIRCPFTHKFDQEDGSQILCRQVAEWFITDSSGTLKSRILEKAGGCRQTRPPSPVVP